MTYYFCAALAVALQAGIARASPDKAADELMFSAAASLERNACGDAIDQWQKAKAQYTSDGHVDGETDALIDLSVAYQHLGQYSAADGALTDAQRLCDMFHDQERTFRVLTGFVDLYTLTRRYDAAQDCANQALVIARNQSDKGWLASLSNAEGNLYFSQGKYDMASQSYQSAAETASGEDRTLVSTSLANAALAASRGGNGASAWRWVREAKPDVLAMPDGRAKVSILLTEARALDGTRPDDALQLCKIAADSARNCGDSIGLSFAQGYQGELLESRHKPGEALIWYRQAAFSAQDVQAADPLYRWERDIGRILAASGDVEHASIAYSNAIDSLQNIRHDLSFGYGNQASSGTFRESVGPVYYEAADLLLRQAEKEPDHDREQSLLRQARQTVEMLKSAELEDYFQDSCFNILKSRSRTIDTVDPHTAVIYLIPLTDRTEILVGTSTGLRQFKAPVGSDQLFSEVRLFRQRLEDRTTQRYLINARRIYDWVIRPIEPTLAASGIDTLVFVPDGELRTIPMSALFDGKSYLIARYSVAITPGLTLMDPRPVTRGNVVVLAAGLSQAVDGFPSLPYVPDELKSVQNLYGGQILLNEQFDEARLRQELIDHNFTIVHIASHAEFGNDARHTFLLAYDKKLSLDELESIVQPSLYRTTPIELLTLSACQTAAGDDRAALGLAGIAIKAGARSAVATLWSVNDQASSQLITDFYTLLHQDSSLSKAKAMQMAQLKLIHDQRYRHPAYWSPYLVIGNWL